MLFAFSRLLRVRRCVVLHLLRVNRGAVATAPIRTGNQPSLAVSGSEGEETAAAASVGGGSPSGYREEKYSSLSSSSSFSSENSRKGRLKRRDSTKDNTSAATLSSPIISKGSSDRSSALRADSEESSAVVRSLQVHSRLAAETQRSRHLRETTQIGESVASGVAHVAQEKIERRRKKWTLTEVEFDVGITERLFPEIRRLPALHELHYGDAIMREVDAATYFAARQHDDDGRSHKKTVSNDDDGVVDMPLTDADFLAFEDQDSLLQQQPIESTSSSSLPLVGNSNGGGGDEVFLSPTQEEQKEEAKEFSLCKSHSGEKDKMVMHGVHTPWFVPEGGVVRLEPLSPSDALCLMRFVLHLRQQTPQHLPVSIQKRFEIAETSEGTTQNDKKSVENRLSLEDVLLYLDTAPPPIIGFTENLSTIKCPALVFVLYTENVSLQNAIGHMAALFNIPQRAFHTCTAVSKMSCGTVLCAVGPNRVQREHLLLLNTMRHPGFVLRVGSIRAVEDEKRCATLFGDLSLWQPLNEVELLLRRVSCGSRQELEHRLRAVQEVGAVFFCANREASLARAATDVLHGFFKSALLNALHRRNAPIPLRHFLARPNLITASRARRASTDATVRQVLKNYIILEGDWSKTIARTPYVWRRRWLNALRSSVWNMMASRRLRHGGRRVLPGDIVLRPEYRADTHRRMLTTVKAEYVMLVLNEGEAARCSVEDVFIPFLRGVYPPELFAPDATEHPIMTRANMLALLREAHAPQLLLGLSDSCRVLLDIRSESSPMLFRRFVIRPVEMSFTILEDKPPVKSTHFDAARLLENDRLRLQYSPGNVKTRGESNTDITSGSCGDDIQGLPLKSSLVSQDLVLERTTIGARLSSGLLAEEFFSPPKRDEYVTLGHVERNLNGNLILATPSTNDEALKTVDRLFTIYVHAVVRNGLAALGHMLREYFILVGVEREDDSMLQHKIHRVRRELDVDTPRLTNPTFCRACYCYDHDALESCAEYQFKRNKHGRAKRRQEVFQELAKADIAGLLPSKGTDGASLDNNNNNNLIAVEGTKKEEKEVSLEMELRLRRRSEEQKWGVHLTAALLLSAVDDVSVLAEGRIRCSGKFVSNNPPNTQQSFWKTLLKREEQLKEHLTNEENEDSLQLSALSHFVKKAIGEEDISLHATDDGDYDSSSFMSQVNQNDGLPLPRLHDAFTSSPSSESGADGESKSTTEKVRSRKLIKQCGWVLTHINDTAVTGRRQVAAVFVKLGKEREVSLKFTATLQGFFGDVCHDGPQPQLAETLPRSIDVVLTRKDGKQKGWGLKFDCDSLLLLNLSRLFYTHESSKFSAVVHPSFVSGVANPAVVDGKYMLSRVNGSDVASQSDVMECLRKLETTGRENVLQLHLVLHSSLQEPKMIMEDPNHGVPKKTKEDIVINETHEYKEKENVTTPSPPPSCSPQCTPLTSAQQKRSIVTIVINRRGEAPPGRWGLRVQRGTLRLQRLQHNDQFSFQVYAAKRQQAVRISDTLRFNSLQKRERNQCDAMTGKISGTTTNSSATTVTTTGEVAFYSHFVYIIVGVNHRHVRSIEELRTSLTSLGDGAAAHAREESVVLQVQQFRLAQIAVNIVRKIGDNDAAVEPVGLRISRDMVIESVKPGSPMAHAIMAATHEGCSLRQLIHNVDSSTALEADEKQDDGVTKPSVKTNSSFTSTKWQFNLDEDTQEQSDAPSPTETVKDEKSGTKDNGIVNPHTYWNMVDGVALMSMYGESEAPQFVWRVLYGVRAGPLRTPQDVERALAPDVKEETLFLQQCLLDN